MEIYTVKKGDTVWKIAQKYGVSYKRLIADNGLTNPDNIVVGQALIILFPDKIYEVKKGDTLYSIAMKYGTTVMSLIQNNPVLLSDPELQPGQELTVDFKTKKEREISINGYAYPFINKRVLVRTLPYLTMLTIFGYGFTEDGELIEINDDPIIKMAYRFKVAPVMLISSITENGNFSTERASRMLNDRELQNKLIDSIIEKMREKGYMGLDIDLEFIDPDDADAFIHFINKVAVRLDMEGYFLNVDLAPKTSRNQKGTLYEAHRYQEIGQAADTVLLMTYEWGYTFVHYDISN